MGVAGNMSGILQGGGGAAAPPTRTGVVDPADYSITAVQDHLNGFPDDADEWARVRELETTGKNRVTLLTWIDENHP